MKNREISYQTSTDYERLYELLKQGKIIIGFAAIKNTESSKLVELNYKNGFFNLNISFNDSDFAKEGFIQICKEYNIRFIDI